ncbi:copper resistance protein B [Marilutibacter maris]|uniref:Copper resistance protein B n=1 Tax=Marilutibacter maris TaxID=1605891 RepID=A0A2U9T455_9GAMM|nr:copper resistance protein B [Lysobacter maris]AWV07293.1 copper resistance protein CopB [Lysobacter maris]KAB8181826.1 copper resistance protein B [Lysobacter maris]
MNTIVSTFAPLPVALAIALAPAPASAQDRHAQHRPQAAQDNDGHAGHGARASMPHEPEPSTATSANDAGDHSGMDHTGMEHVRSPQQPSTPIPTVSDADRRAAFPELHAHATHGDSIHSYWSLDRLEAWDADEEGTGTAWEALAWVGGDIDRLWLRSEGERTDAGTESADLEVLYGHSVSRWWDVVAGIRHDFGGEGPSQTFAAFGVQGLAPYKFEVSATGYVGESGQTAASLEAEYDTLISNRLILQWSAEAELYGKDDPARGIGSGLSSLEAGARLRYEISRRFAPYVGVSWERSYGGTADLKRAHGEDIEDTRLVAGVRVWF